MASKESGGRIGRKGSRGEVEVAEGLARAWAWSTRTLLLAR